MIPVWLLDIDGVVNACSKKPDRNVWPADQWIHTKVTVNSHSWPVLVARPVVEFIRRVYEDGLAEIRWHTTWQHDAAALEKAVDLPHLAVQDCPEYETRHEIAGWFKLPAAERVVMHECRALVWTDDDLTWELRRPAGRAFEMLRQAARILTVSPSEQTGLTPKHLHQIGEFLGIDAGRESGRLDASEKGTLTP